jgi:hypothetical protein
MATGDKVKIYMGTTLTSDQTVPVYDFIKNPDGTFSLDRNGAARPLCSGGVLAGSTGVVTGPPVQVNKLELRNAEKVVSYGDDYTPLVPVRFDYYQKIAYVQAEHVHIQGSIYDSPAG